MPAEGHFQPPGPLGVVARLPGRAHPAPQVQFAEVDRRAREPAFLAGYPGRDADAPRDQPARLADRRQRPELLGLDLVGVDLLARGPLAAERGYRVVPRYLRQVHAHRPDGA